MAGDCTSLAEQQQQQQLPQSNPLQTPHPKQNPLPKNNKPDVLKNETALHSLPPKGPLPWVVILEEGKYSPVFWNGENPVPLVKWGPFSRRHRPPFATIGEFLSTYVAGKYLQKCSLSLQATSTKYINNLQMSDPFSKILDHQTNEVHSVTLMLSHPVTEDNESGYSKFSLYIREQDKKKVLWDGEVQKYKIVAGLNQSDMGLTIGKCLQKYVAQGYLRGYCEVDLVKESSDMPQNNGKEELSRISLNDFVKTLFTGNFASIIIRRPTEHISMENTDELFVPPGMRLPTFISPTPSCHWLNSTWKEIRAEVGFLLGSVDTTLRNTVLECDVLTCLIEKKRALETSIRRRCRIVDEIWRCFITLQRAHNDVLNGNPRFGQAALAARSSSSIRFGTPRPSNQSVVPSARNSTVCFKRDALLPLPNEAFPEHAKSCFEMLSSTLIRYGIEMELYDVETRGLNRVAGLGLGLAFFVAVCSVAFYL